MILTQLKIKGQPDAQLSLPESIAEVSLEKMLDFNEAFEENRPQMQDNRPGVDGDDVPFELLAIRCVSAYFDIDYRLLLDNKLTTNAGNLTAAAGSLYDAILPVYAHLNNVIGSYSFDNRPKSYQIGGQSFFLPYELIGEKSPTVAESIEVLEVKRLLNTDTKNGKFTEAIRTAAILMRLEGERLPHDQPDIDKFISDRTKLFLDSKIGMQPGLDSVFFLTNFINR